LFFKSHYILQAKTAVSKPTDPVCKLGSTPGARAIHLPWSNLSVNKSIQKKLNLFYHHNV